MDFLETVRQAGIVGAGGAGFPTHVKLKASAEYFIVNAAECEPLIETDKFIMREYADELVVAIEACAKAVGASKKVIGLKAKYKAEIQSLTAAVKKAGSDITIFEMPTFYPAGDEQILVRLVTGKSVPERGLPLNVGAVVDNVGTLLNVYDALGGRPVTHKYLSVVGSVKAPVMLKVPVGTPVSECIAAASPTIKDYALVIGGPMMGKYFGRDAEPALFVTKTTGNIIVLPADHYLFRRATMPLERIKAQARAACIQCRFCTELCPRYLSGHSMRPNLVMRNIYREKLIDDDAEYLRAFGDAANCSECGVCEMFACPMGLSPRKVNIFIKGRLRERGIDVPKNASPQAREDMMDRLVPTDRLIARLGLSEWNGLHAKECLELAPERVSIALKQHIGAPAVPCVSEGGEVKCGELIAAAAENALSANIHASMDGVIEHIDANTAVIRAKGV